MKTALVIAGSLLLGLPAAHAGTIVNLSAGPNSPNAGKSSGTYPYNPVTISLDAGTYSVSVIGKAAGGAYDAYAVYADNGTNTAFTNSSWSVSLDGGATSAFIEPNAGRSNTALTSLSTYSALSPYVFTLTGRTTVAFAVDDSAYPYFGDDSGGVSLSVASVPEPASLGLLGLAAIGVVAARFRKKAA